MAGMGGTDMMETYMKLLFEGEYEKADSLMRSMIPQKLYKFVLLTDEDARNEKRFRSLEDNTIFFSTVNKVNDPYEFKSIYLTEEELVGLGWSEDRARDILAEYDPSAWFSITCLSGNDEHCLPMWAYYTNAYRGYCVEYSVDDPAQIYRVIYDAQRMPGAFAVSRMLFAHEAEKEKEAEYYQRLLKMVLYMKHSSWSWENEYRILNVLTEGMPSGSNVGLSKIGLRTSRIIAGLNCKPEHRERLRAICRDNGFAFNQAYVSRTSFGFEEE